ncbi:type VI secretion system protein IglI family protein [Archangium lansingense]|uniref:type VI secretion system protein IglI family protein n=1 Tax=Archangium lansingense TaxID=2995310 RepID=UPI003B82A4A9
MRDLSLCVRPFETDSQRLEAHDPRFQRVTELAQGGKYTEAADAVEGLLAENLFEVRLLGYFLFAVLHEEGLPRLGAILEALAELIRSNWEGLPARDKRTVLLNKSVTWLFQTLFDTLSYHQAKKDERWQGWWKASTVAQAAAAIQKAQELHALLSVPGYRSGSEALAKLLPWLRDLHAQLVANMPQDPPALPPQQEKQEPEPPAEPEGPSPFLKLGQPVQLMGSAHLVDLCNKLKAFELLIERKEFQKAALVSDDILATLEGFDPRRFFPDLFASFGALLNKHVRDVQEHWESKNSREWKALAQFYQVDLERFVRPE